MGTCKCGCIHNRSVGQWSGLFSFSKTEEGTTIGINKNNLLLRGCVLRNTSAVVGVVVYAGQSLHRQVSGLEDIFPPPPCYLGHETKSLLNNSGPRAKRSKLERDINIDVIFQVIILFVLSIVGAVGVLCMCVFWGVERRSVDDACCTCMHS